MGSICILMAATQNNKPDILLSNIDTKVSPGTDFYFYANGGWFNKNPIPETESRWGIGNLVKDEIYIKLRKISEDASASRNLVKNSNEQRIGDLYRSAMDSAGMDKEGIRPLAAEIKMIGDIRDMQGVIAMMAKLQTYGIGAGA